MPTTDRPQPLLYLDDHRGTNIPRDFVTGTRRECVSGVSPHDWDICGNPDHEWYWEAWESILSGATVQDDSGQTYTLEQDGALWLIPTGMEWTDRDGWVYPDDSTTDDEGV